MLVLARKANQSIVIDHPSGPVVVVVVEVRGEKVRLGVTADRSVAIHRQEVWDAIHNPKQSFADRAPELVTPHLPENAFKRM